LAAKLTLGTLKMTIKTRNIINLIHHSDKGTRYCSHDYVDLLKTNSIKISMAAKGIPP